MRSWLLVLWSSLTVTLGCSAPTPIVLGCRTGATAEQLAARPSPLDSVVFSVGGRRAQICYGRPSARARQVFGGIVPYDTLWRTGANEPTILHLPFEASIAGLRVPAGDYSIYSIPGRKQFTLIINKSTSQWGITAPERGQDGVMYQSAYSDKVRRQELGRVPVAIESIEHVEQLLMRAEPAGDQAVDILVEWERTRIRIPFRVISR